MGDRSQQSGATLVEAVIAVIALGIAIPPLVGLFREVAARGADDIYQQVAITYGESLLEEIVSKSFEDPGLASGSFGTEESPRSAYDDVDDYDGLGESPPRRLDGTLLDQYGGFTRTATVDNVTTAAPDPLAPSADGSTDCKRIRVKVAWTGGKGGELTLSTLRTRACGSTDPLDEIASAASANRRTARRCELDLVSNSPCDAILASFSLSASASHPDLDRLRLGNNNIWTGNAALPTGLRALNRGSSTDRTINAGASETLDLRFESAVSGTITYTLVLVFTNGTSSTITFTIPW